MKQRRVILLVITAISLVSSLYLYYVVGILSLYILITLSVLTVVLPLISGLYTYRGRPARFWLILTAFALLSALVFTVDASATQVTFESVCKEMASEYQYENRGAYGGHLCLPMNESDARFRVGSMSSTVGGIVYWPYMLALLVNVLHAPYMVWRFSRKIYKK